MLDIAFIKVSIVLNVKANANTKIDIINRKFLIILNQKKLNQELLSNLKKKK